MFEMNVSFSFLYNKRNSYNHKTERMKQTTIDKFIKHLQEIKDLDISIKDYCRLKGLGKDYIYDTFNKVCKEKDKISQYSYINTLYNDIKNKKSAKNSDIEKTDNKSKVEIIRDENGRISNYKFEIFIKNKPSLSGTLTRDEMSLIYRLYSSYGSNITQREVSRFFPEYSLYDFKRILRTFNITKASAPFPQHIIEESSKEELLDMQFREKEKDFLKSYEAEKVRQLDNQLKKYMKENADLKEQLTNFGDLISTADLNLEPFKCEISKSNKDLFIYLSDMHIGAEVGENSLYNNTYNKEEVRRRLITIFQTIYNIDGYDNIVVCNIGDSLDGEDNQTTRGGHYLPQNMDNKEQIKCFLELMSEFFNSLATIPNNGIYYYAVGESNHGGTYEYATQLALSNILEVKGVKCKVFDKFIGYFEHKDQTFILCHGKDNKDMFKNWPLTLNDKIEGIINEYMDINGISRAIVIKGDLHQSATTYGKRFVYKSVGSLFGSSGWIMKNFGNTKACCDYSIFKGKQRLDGNIILN